MNGYKETWSPLEQHIIQSSKGDAGILTRLISLLDILSQGIVSDTQRQVIGRQSHIQRFKKTSNFWAQWYMSVVLVLVRQEE